MQSSQTNNFNAMIDLQNGPFCTHNNINTNMNGQAQRTKWNGIFVFFFGLFADELELCVSVGVSVSVMSKLFDFERKTCWQNEKWMIFWWYLNNNNNNNKNGTMNDSVMSPTNDVTNTNISKWMNRRYCEISYRSNCGLCFVRLLCPQNNELYSILNHNNNNNNNINE